MNRISCVAASASCALLAIGSLSRQARADDVHVFSGGAPQVALRAMAPDFEKATGHRVLFTFALVTDVQQRLARGEDADLILLPVPLIAATEKTVALRPEGRRALARVGIAVIAPEGATPPDISTAEDIRKLLVASRSVALPEPNTPSGAHLARVVAQLGLDETVRQKTIIRAAIDGGADLVARGEADIGFYLLSEVQSARGVHVVGLLPSDLQSYVVYGTAIPASSLTAGPAASLVEFLAGPSKNEKWKAAGFELLQGRN